MKIEIKDYSFIFLQIFIVSHNKNRKENNDLQKKKEKKNLKENKRI